MNIFVCIYLTRIPNLSGTKPSRAVFRCVQDAGRSHKRAGRIGIRYPRTFALLLLYSSLALRTDLPYWYIICPIYLQGVVQQNTLFYLPEEMVIFITFKNKHWHLCMYIYAKLEEYQHWLMVEHFICIMKTNIKILKTNRHTEPPGFHLATPISFLMYTNNHK